MTPVKVHHNEETDLLTIVVSDAPVARTVEFDHGIVDLDESGEILAVEIFDASELIHRGLHELAHPNLDAVLAERAKVLLREVGAKISAQASS